MVGSRQCVEPGLQTPEGRRGTGIVQHKCRTGFMRPSFIIIPDRSLSFPGFFFSYLQMANMRCYSDADV